MLFLFFLFFYLRNLLWWHLWAGVSCCCDVKNTQAETETFMVYVTWISTVVSVAYGASLLHSHQSTGSITLLTLWSAAIVFQKCWTPTQVDGVISLGWFFQFERYFSNELDCNGLYVGWLHYVTGKWTSKRVGGYIGLQS